MKNLPKWVCTKCLKNKSEEDFYIRTERLKRGKGRASWCKLCISLYNKKRQIECAASIKEAKSKRYFANVELSRKRVYESKKRHLARDPVFKMKENLRRRLHLFLSAKNIKKSTKTFAYIGCTPTQLRLHLESLFIDGMNWNNYGYNGWHVDHIKPMARFDLSDENQIFEAMNYKNLQPLWAQDNWAKGTK